MTQLSRLGFIGAGKIVEVIAKGLITSGVTKTNNIQASAPTDTDVEAMSKLGAMTTLSNTDIIRNNKVVILAVRPHVVQKVLTEISADITDEHLIVSVAAGITLDAMQNILPPGVKVARVMPNTASQVMEGVSTFCVGKEGSSEDKAIVKKMFSSLGLCVEIDEKLMDVAAGFSGAGPAYVYTIIQALADGAVRGGIPRADALGMASQTVLGAAKMVIETGKHPIQLRDEVCSPGGVTITGVHALESGRLGATLMNAVTDATHRSAEIAGQLSAASNPNAVLRKVEKVEVFAQTTVDPSMTETSTKPPMQSTS